MKRVSTVTLTIIGLVLGFTIPFVASIEIWDALAFFIFALFMVIDWFTLLYPKQFIKGLLIIPLFYTSFFSLFLLLTPGFPSPGRWLWPILYCLPIVLMCFFNQILDRSLIQRVREDMVFLLSSLVLLAWGIFWGVARAEQMDLVRGYVLGELFVISLTGTQVFLLSLAFLFLLIIGVWTTKSKK